MSSITTIMSNFIPFFKPIGKRSQSALAAEAKFLESYLDLYGLEREILGLVETPAIRAAAELAARGEGYGYSQLVNRTVRVGDFAATVIARYSNDNPSGEEGAGQGQSNSLHILGSQGDREVQYSSDANPTPSYKYRELKTNLQLVRDALMPDAIISDSLIPATPQDVTNAEWCRNAPIMSQPVDSQPRNVPRP